VVTRPALLDVNLLIALFDPDHVHHDLAHDWFADNRSRGWATCPLTENGLVRVLSNAKYPWPATRAAEILKRLRTFCDSREHQFWADTISLCDDSLFAWSFIAGHRQLSNIYLLGLAHKRGGVLATFDRTIPVKAITGSRRELLEVIAPATEP
jgi:toxin-antitoxin system PIN domain toxin